MLTSLIANFISFPLQAGQPAQSQWWDQAKLWAGNNDVKDFEVLCGS